MGRSSTAASPAVLKLISERSLKSRRVAGGTGLAELGSVGRVQPYSTRAHAAGHVFPAKF